MPFFLVDAYACPGCGKPMRVPTVMHAAPWIRADHLGHRRGRGRGDRVHVDEDVDAPPSREYRGDRRADLVTRGDVAGEPDRVRPAGRQQPTDRGAVFHALFWPRVGAVVLPAVAAVAGLGCVAWGLGQPVAPRLLTAFLGLLAGQGFCFAALGMWVSCASRSSEQALLRGLFLWIAAALLVDFLVLAVLLRWDIAPGAVFALAGVNPIQAGRIGILAAIDPEVGVLGPRRGGRLVATTCCRPGAGGEGLPVAVARREPDPRPTLAQRGRAWRLHDPDAWAVDAPPFTAGLTSARAHCTCWQSPLRSWRR